MADAQTISAAKPAERPLLTLAIPTYNRAANLALLLDHLATEQHPHDDAPGTVDAMSDEEVERQLRARLERNFAHRLFIGV